VVGMVVGTGIAVLFVAFRRFTSSTSFLGFLFVACILKITFNKIDCVNSYF
jgi:hypothetical protein